MKWWHRLSFRLSVFILLLAIVPLAGFGITTINDIRRVRLQSIAEIHKAIVTHLAQSDAPLQNPLGDDREVINEGDKVVLIVEDDVSFATTLLKFCREKGFKGLVSLTGEEGLKLVEQYPLNAIILDIHLPGIDGWKVLEFMQGHPFVEGFCSS